MSDNSAQDCYTIEQANLRLSLVCITIDFIMQLPYSDTALNIYNCIYIISLEISEYT
jgi:hypothetical protein